MNTGIAVVMTAWRRPYYLEPVLESWARAAARVKPDRFVISLGVTDRHSEQLDVIARARSRFPVALEVLTQSLQAHQDGPHRAIGEAGNYVFSGGNVQFLVFGEEDVVVSDDVLEYMVWAAAKFRDARVLCACAHSAGGQGWDRHVPAQDGDANQQAVRLLPYFNAWCWGTWRDRWQSILEPSWDWDCTSGGPMDSGYDWNIIARVIPRYGLRSVVPEASRSQNIGEREGLYTTPQSWSFSQASSFREHREPVTYEEVPWIP